MRRHGVVPLALPLAVFVAFVITWDVFHNLLGPAAGVLAVIPALVATWFLGTRAGLITQAAAMLVNMLQASEWTAAGFFGWWVDRGGLLAFIVLAVVIFTVGRLRMLERQRAASALELRALSWKLAEIQEIQSRHLANELHDEIGQQLTGLKLRLEDGGVKAVAIARDITQDLIRRVRDISMELSPSTLDDFGLLPALRDQASRFSTMTGVGVDMTLSELAVRPSKDVEIAAFRIVQEALTNAARHSGVVNVRVTVKAYRKGLRLLIEDSGQGFGLEKPSPDDIVRSHGLSGMRERALSVGGMLLIKSSPKSGTRVTAVLPLTANHDQNA